MLILLCFVSPDIHFRSRILIFKTTPKTLDLSACIASHFKPRAKPTKPTSDRGFTRRKYFPFLAIYNCLTPYVKLDFHLNLKSSRTLRILRSCLFATIDSHAEPLKTRIHTSRAAHQLQISSTPTASQIRKWRSFWPQTLPNEQITSKYQKNRQSKNTFCGKLPPLRGHVTKSLIARFQAYPCF